jgi:hypothetical protein
MRSKGHLATTPFNRFGTAKCLLHEREIGVLVPGRPQLFIHEAGMLGLNMPKAATPAPDRRAK